LGSFPEEILLDPRLFEEIVPALLQFVAKLVDIVAQHFASRPAEEPPPTTSIGARGNERQNLHMAHPPNGVFCFDQFNGSPKSDDITLSKKIDRRSLGAKFREKVMVSCATGGVRPRKSTLAFTRRARRVFR
jgi:hypothetical protein